MQIFDKNVQKAVELFSHPVWFILRSEEKCPCVGLVSKQPDPDCKVCLGTGNKISLARVNAAHQNNKLSLRGTGMGFSEMDIVNVYYTTTKTSIHNGDIIVDGSDTDIVKDIYYEHSDAQDIVFYRIETAPYRVNTDKLRKLLADTLKEAGFNG